MCTIIACLYLSLGVSYMEHMPSLPNGRFYTLDATYRKSPYGIISVGTEHSIRPSLSIGAEIRHQSSMRTGRDYGENTAGLFLRFTPFR